MNATRVNATDTRAIVATGPCHVYVSVDGDTTYFGDTNVTDGNGVTLSLYTDELEPGETLYAVCAEADASTLYVITT